MQYELILGDCLEKMKEMPDNSVDAICADPPAGIAFMNKKWDKDKGGGDSWIAWMTEVAQECLRVIKPGGHALIWTLPRTSQMGLRKNMLNVSDNCRMDLFRAMEMSGTNQNL
jgi:DNA modification methylase